MAIQTADLSASLIEKWRARVSIPSDPEACWTWSGGIVKGGYAFLTHQRAGFYAHQLSYVLHHGAIPAGLWVLHTCDNRPCTNPRHLYAGTPSDNAKDRERRGRGGRPSRTVEYHPRRGEQNSRAILTDAAVIEIRRLYRAGGVTQKTLAERFGVKPNIVSGVVRGKRWAHVTEVSQ